MPEAHLGIVGMASRMPDGVLRRGDVAPSPAPVAADDVFRSADPRARGSVLDDAVAARMRAEAGDPFVGTVERRYLPEGTAPSAMEVAAVVAALADAGVDPSAVDALLAFSHLSDHAAPKNHGLIAHAVGLRRNALALGVDGEGSSFPAHLHLAAALGRAGSARVAVVVQSCTASRLMDPSHPTSRAMGDGAVATVLGPVDEGLGVLGARHLQRGDWHGAVRLAPVGDAPWVRGDQHREALRYRAVDPALSAAAGGSLAILADEVCRPLLREHGVAPGDLALFVTHEPRRWATEVMAERLGVALERTETVFPELGYTLAASPAFSLERAYRRGRLSPGDLVLVWSSGLGYLGTAVLLRWARDTPATDAGATRR